MTRTEHRSIRLTAKTVAKAKKLANLWKPPHLATRISLADVLRAPKRLDEDRRTEPAPTRRPRRNGSLVGGGSVPRPDRAQANRSAL